MKPEQVVAAYRKAACELFGVSVHEASIYIVEPDVDRGAWAPQSLGIVRLEADLRTTGDTGTLPDRIGYWAPDGLDNCVRLDEAAGCNTFIEYINAGVAAIWSV